MRFGCIAVCVIGLLCKPLFASTTLFTDNFESYSAGALDKNAAGSPNTAPNGSGNPWWGLSTGSSGSIANTAMQVVGAQNGVTPHSGTQMIRGTDNGGDYSVVWHNIAYRYNSGQPFSGNLTYTFWFYDPNGATNGAQYKDNSAVSYYSDNSSNQDYPTSQNIDSSATIERLQLGGASFQANTTGFPQTYNSSEYQARVVNSIIGYDTEGWINLPITRSIGWHEGEIVIGPANNGGQNTVSFYIDNLTTPLLTTTTLIDRGYNNVEFNAGGSGTNAIGYFDDATLILTPEPGSLAVLGVIGVLMARRRSRRILG